MFSCRAHATRGQHRFYNSVHAGTDECGESVRGECGQELRIKNITEKGTPLRCFGYSISYRGGRALVRIERRGFLEFKAYLRDNALRWSEEELYRRLRYAPFEPYGPVVRQLFRVREEVNEIRRRACRSEIATDCVRTKRRSVRVFEQR